MNRTLTSALESLVSALEESESVPDTIAIVSKVAHMIDDLKAFASKVRKVNARSAQRCAFLLKQSADNLAQTQSELEKIGKA